ncbi:Mutator-like transposase domain-containing protein [Camponotus japonicus]
MGKVNGRYRWKGKIVSKKVYEKRLLQQNIGKKRKKVIIDEPLQVHKNSIEEDDEEEISSLDGRRIVDLKFLGQQMWCVSCKEALSFEYIENEYRRGLGSHLAIRCHKCLIINEILTCTMRPSSDKRNTRFDINYKAVIGVLHSGLGWSHLQKLLACMNVPCFQFKTFKKYEQEVGCAAEDVAKQSCRDAAQFEKNLTVEQAENIEKQL